MALGKRIGSLIGESLGINSGFAVSIGAHCGIGSMPIIYFGNKEQKERYLPRLATGELLAAYALTETGSGSDALSAKTKAVLSEDGKHYILNGSKMWITNAGFADVVIVFAKIDGKDFTAFIVEKTFEGFGLGAEETKMGIKSSSTRLITFDNVKVPVENLLGVRGEGHKIAFNILNIGRFSLGSSCAGFCKLAMEDATKYAIERRAFGKSISEFGLMRQKLAEMAVRTFATESMAYRCAGYIDQILEGVTFAQEGAEKIMLSGIREYAIECAIAKVFGSEALDYVVDEAVQIHGGYGFSREYDVERYYRDSRINRIFEGTNEINRLLAVDMLLKKGMKGELPLLAKAKSLMDELMGLPSFDFEEDTSLLAEERKMVANAKKIVLFISGLGVQKYMTQLEQEQELLGMAADLLIHTYVMESAVLRTLKQAQRGGEESARLMVAMTQVFCHDAMEKIGVTARTAMAAVAEGDNLLTMMAALRRLVKHKPLNTVELRRTIADQVVAEQGYPL
jgi:alkylation response protein AidB-like acyl-CoA dehydrogenase